MSKSVAQPAPEAHHVVAARTLVQVLKDMGLEADEIVSRARTALMGNPQTGEVPHPGVTQVISMIEGLIADTK